MKCGYACAQAARRVHTPESKAEYHRAYRQNNREWINEKQRAARHGEKREHILERDKRLYHQNLDKSRQMAREYGNRHKEARIARSKAWCLDNPVRAHWHRTRNNIATQMGVRPSLVPDHVVDARVMLINLKAAISRTAMPSAIETETRRAETLGSVEDEGSGRQASPNSPSQGSQQG